MLARAQAYSETHRFKFNAAKCKVMSNLRGRTWKLGEEEIKQVEDFTYLGITFGKRGLESHGEQDGESSKRPSGQILTLRKMYGVGVSTCVKMWNVIGEPVMNYGAEVWVVAKGTRESQEEYGENTNWSPGVNECGSNPRGIGLARCESQLGCGSSDVLVQAVLG